MTKILITGALGQIGSELTLALRKEYGNDKVIISDLKESSDINDNYYEKLDVLDKENLENIVTKHQITIIYHLAAILSANGEKNPNLCWNINMNGLHNILEIGKKHQLQQIICPSSIAAFGPETPRDNTPQQTILLPKTMYGVTKVAGELLCEYYVNKFNMDIRGIRYPGLISHKALPGGGTTDYAVEIFYEAIKNKSYNCFLKKDTKMPMMFMDDAIRGTIELAKADRSKLKNHCDFNFAAMSFTPEEIANEIKKHIPEFSISYNPDFRQEIADTWPKSIDDSEARKQWNWNHEFDLEKMVKIMLDNLKKKLS